jgi:hypothetical protein
MQRTLTSFVQAAEPDERASLHSPARIPVRGLRILSEPEIRTSSLLLFWTAMILLP